LHVPVAETSSLQPGGFAWVSILRSDGMWSEKQKYLFDRESKAMLRQSAPLHPHALL
jgi:hypothetical protein